MKATIAVFLGMLLLFGCAGNGAAPEPVEEPSGPEVSGYEAEVPEEPEGENGEVIPAEEVELEWETQPEDEVLEEYSLAKLVDGNGGVRDYYGADKYSSESMSLMLEFAVIEQDKELFDREFNFVLEHFLDPEQDLVFAELDNNYQPMGGVKRGTSVDNMRIAKALRGARLLWGDIAYKEYYEKISDAVLEKVTNDNRLVHDVWWDEDIEVGYWIHMSDPDWEFMKWLAKRQPMWTIVSVKTLPLVSNCQMDNGMFSAMYDISDGTCKPLTGDTMSATREMLWAAINFYEFETLPPGEQLLMKLESDWDNKGKISDAYDAATGIGSGEESIGVYALTGRLAVKFGRCSFAEEMLDKATSYRVEDRDDPLYGLLAKDGEATAFDNFETVMLMEEMKNCVQAS